MSVTTGIPFEDYCGIEAVNFSTLQYAHLSALHYRNACDNPREPTAGMRLGSGAHAAILEPDRFPLDYAVYDGRRQGKAWQEFDAANTGRTILTVTEYEKCIAMRDAVHRNPIAAKLLAQGQAEVTVEWTDEATGLPCKARLDHLSGGLVTDLKTTTSTDAWAFQNVSAKLLYHAKLAFYQRGIGVAGLCDDDHAPRIIAVEQEPPHDVAVFRLTADALFVGQELCDELLAKVAACRDSGKWPGRYDEELELTLPTYLLPADGDMGGWGGMA